MKKYKLLAIFILGFAMFVFHNSDVYAAKAEACAHTLNDDCYAEKFGLFFDLSDDHKKVTIRVGKDYEDADGNSVVFRVLTINGKEVKKGNGNHYTVSYNSSNHDITIPVTLKKKGNIIKMETTKNVTVKAKDGYEKKTGKISVTISIDEAEEMNGDPIDKSGTGSKDGLRTLSVGVKNIDCSDVHPDGHSIYDDQFASFRAKFCFAKLKSKGEYNRGKVRKAGFNSNEIFSNNYCEKTAKKYTDKFGQPNFDRNYYQNIKYYYAQTTFKYNNLGRYQYNYSVLKPHKSKTLSCELECQESVTVEYGPPVAIKAGLCFQYRVKVTSRVYCWVSKKPEEPDHPTGYCTPGPTCYHSGVAYRQGGPTDEFEKCVKECDGGKYTQKCSNKCYEKVYGKAINQYEIKKTASGALEACAKDSGYHGCYYRNSKKGAIHWWGQSGSFGKYRGGTGNFAPGRWYEEHPGSWGLSTSVYYVPRNDGFYRADHGTGYCLDSCNWSGCAWNKYLNPGQADKDWESNKTIYNEAIKKCEAKATCNTTTTTYEISAAYYRAKNEKGDTERIVVHFPYSGPDDVKLNRKIDADGATNPDKLTTCDKKPNNNAEVMARKKSTIFDYGMCYGESCPTDKIGYMTAWTFPGSYENIKTGEFSYNPQYSGDEAWDEYKDRFCVPKDALSINSYWYQWYFHQVEKTNTSEYDKLCLTPAAKKIISSSTYKDDSKHPIEYNIYARTKKFGYFKWNFDIRCFFAIDKGDNSDPTGQKTTLITDGNKDKCQPTEYRVRTVTTTDLFPDGKDSSGATKERSIGYNWKDEASLAKQSLPESYKVSPSTTLATIQKTGNDIYKEPAGSAKSSKYIDYEFTLTPELLRKIKTYNTKLASYDIYCGKIRKNTNIAEYNSNLFRSGNGTNDSSIAACKTIGNGVIKGKLGTPGVNNQ